MDGVFFPGKTCSGGILKKKQGTSADLNYNIYSHMS